MKSLFNAADNNEFIVRINKLTPEAKAVWGKMTVAQMLAHCQQPLKVAFGELKLKRGIPGILFGSYFKKKLTGKATFSRNSPTDPAFVVKEDKNFEEEKNKLIPLIQKFAKEGPAAIINEKHPFFGKLTPQDWDILQSKHLDHHLSQFGV
jgi:Protein of unknown function (DUF1569)